MPSVVLSQNNILPEMRSIPKTTDQSALARRGYFYVGGQYVGSGNTRALNGQAFVEVLVPKHPARPYPIVMIPGGGQAGTNFLQTPDGRPGWADYFLGRGYVVYVVDVPGRARSPYRARLDGDVLDVPPSGAAASFVAPERHNQYPQAKFHTQWPDQGTDSESEGSPLFDQFVASQYPSIKDQALQETLAKDAIDALLDRIGPSVVLTHSQGGLFGWAIADGRPKLVKAIVAVEPSGPPFQNLGAGTIGASKARVWGITDIPVAYDPPVTDPAQLQTETESSADGPDLVPCVEQKPPAHKLVNLEHVPVFMILSQASYHAPYDHCTAKFLQDAGVPVDFKHLTDLGIFGNAHMMMLEKNNQQIAAAIDDWLVKTLPRP
jgi:pimeloyl-ACP methyl ester carboxylesterase